MILMQKREEVGCSEQRNQRGRKERCDDEAKERATLTDVIRNEGNAAKATSLFLTLSSVSHSHRVTLKLTHIAPSFTYTFPPHVGQCAEQ